MYFKKKETMKTLISIVTPCYNEEENIQELRKQVLEVVSKIQGYEFEHIFIDNASTDRTQQILRQMAKEDNSVKVILNLKNFGHIRSPYYALLQANGSAVIQIVSDLQDPPKMIKDFVREWEAGHQIVIGVKKKSEENRLLFAIRCLYYRLLKKMSETEQIENFTGFGLYDRSFLDIIRQITEPYPYLRGLVAEYGVNRLEIEYVQPRRKKGKTNNNFYTLYDMAMTGFVNHSKVPLRLASFIGFSVAILSLMVAIIYFIIKLIHWDEFNAGIAPLVIGVFFFSAVQLFFIGIIGEYIGAIYTQVKRRPLVIEKERINFDK